MQHQLRVARPVRDLERSIAMYRKGLGLDILGRFADHQGFDGAMLGKAGMDYHFEFTYCHPEPMQPNPTHEDLLVFYLPDANEWQERCALLLSAGFTPLASFNPYWEVRGRTFEDADGYRVVLENAKWQTHETT
jgi:catechol 2,3-dioxygenase-like lactoylglutathione lyase family enzyme